MAMSINKIRKTGKGGRNDSGGRVRSLQLDHPGVGELKKRGVVAAGIDERVGGSAWGETTRGTHLFFYVISGRVAATGNGAEAGAGEMLHFPAAGDKFLEAPDGELVAVWMHISDIRPWSDLQVSAPSAHHTSVPGRLLYELMEALLLEAVSATPEAAEVLPRLSLLLFHYLLRQLGGTSARDRELMNRLAGLWNEVSGSLGQDWPVRRLSRRMHMSESHFHREVIRLQGRKPMEIVQGMRMEQAAMLLKTTSLGLDAIAPRVGYGTAYALSHAFYRHMGIRPGRYRRK